MKRQTHWRLIAILAAAGFTGSAAAQAPAITPAQQMELATRALSHFAGTRTPHDFDTVLLTISAVGDATSPLDRDFRIREQQTRDAFSVWFLIFHTLDGMKLAKYDPSASENRCYPNLAPKDVKDEAARKEYQAELDANQKRCGRNAFQLLWTDLDARAQTALHKFVLKLSSGDDPRSVLGSEFAWALAKSGLSGERGSQLWSIFEDTRTEPDKPNGKAAAIKLDDTVTAETARTWNDVEPPDTQILWSEPKR